MLLAHILGIPVEESLVPLAGGTTGGMLLVLAGVMRGLFAARHKARLQAK